MAMSTFNTKKVLYGSTSLIPTIANSIRNEFLKEDYEVTMESLSSGGYDISITKGGLFKAVVGLKTALKVTLRPANGNISFEAGVGIWGQQAIPTVISMLFFWPVIITQMWGIITQAQLDDKALDIARDVIATCGSGSSLALDSSSSTCRFCTSCGAQNPSSAKFCANCGKAI